MFKYILICLTVITVTQSTVINDLLDIFQYYKNQVVQLSQDKVTLKIYYECLCPGCKEVHKVAIDPLLKEMGEYIDFKTYPYGNARMVNRDGKTEVICQHGEDECYGNKLHACAIDILKNATLSEFYNTCMMSETWGGKGSTDMDAIKLTKGANQVFIDVYYESLCPDCELFHNGQFDKLIKEMGSYITFATYPYGNAKTIVENGKTVVKCQHGEAECYGNKLHACAINKLRDATLSEFYNSCMMAARWGGRGSTDMDATQCGATLNVDAVPIMECAKSQEGEDLLEYYGRESETASFHYVPYVLVNGKELKDPEQLKAQVCAEFAIPPPPCQNFFNRLIKC